MFRSFSFMAHELTSFPDTNETDAPASAETLASVVCPHQSEGASKISPSGATHPLCGTASSNSESSQSLQLVRTFAPDEEKQLSALRLLVDAPSTEDRNDEPSPY